MPPVIVPAVEGEPLEFNHRQAIAASSTLRRVAFELNRAACERIGKRGFIYLAARRTFLELRLPAEAAGAKSMLTALKTVLVRRYRIEGFDVREIAPILKGLGLTNRCNQAFAAGSGHETSAGAASEEQSRITGGSADRKAPSEPPVDLASAISLVDEVIAAMSPSEGAVAMVERHLWLRLIEEARLVPQVSPIEDEHLLYRGVKLHPTDVE